MSEKVLYNRLSQLTGKQNFAEALVTVERWAKSHRALAARDSAAPRTVAESATDAALDPATAHATLQDVAEALGCDADHDSIEKALATLFAAITGEHDDTSPASHGLTATQLAICKETGCTPEDFTALRRHLGQTAESLTARVRAREANVARIGRR